MEFGKFWSLPPSVTGHKDLKGCCEVFFNRPVLGLRPFPACFSTLTFYFFPPRTLYLVLLCDLHFYNE